MFHHFCQLLSYNLRWSRDPWTGAAQAAAVFWASQDTSITYDTCSQNLSARNSLLTVMSALTKNLIGFRHLK